MTARTEPDCDARANFTSGSESARLPGTAEGREDEEREGRGGLKTEQHPGASQVAAGGSLCASAASFPLPLLN